MLCTILYLSFEDNIGWKLSLYISSWKVLQWRFLVCLTAQILMLSHNKLVDWPSAVLGSIPRLQELHLAYNPFRKVHPTFLISSVSVKVETHFFTCCFVVSWVEHVVSILYLNNILAFWQRTQCHSSTRLAVTDYNLFCTETVSSGGIYRNCKDCCARFEWNTDKPASSSCISRDA